MPKYFEKFPRIAYDINGGPLTNYDKAVNIFFRLRFIRKTLENTGAYYEYLITDADTPEILADRFYGDSEAHWIILLANNIIDPQYDWPLNVSDFNNYIIDKYTSIENAQSTIHHYEKVIQREESLSGIVTETRFEINYANLTSNLASSLSSVPYDYYTGLAEEQSVSTYNMGSGRTVVETISREAISCYDYELAENEKKRNIKLIRKEFYGQIMREFDRYTDYEKRLKYIRRLV